MTDVAQVCARYANNPAALLEILHDLQEQHGYIDTGEHLPLLARLLNRSRAEIHGVITFYSDFRTAPQAPHCLRVCRGEACQAAGGVALFAHAEHLARDDVAVEEVFCLGNCALGPALVADGELRGRVDAVALDAIVGGWR